MKLVRDMIPAIILESGGTCKWRYTSSREEHTLLLSKKVHEEVQEYLDATSHEECLEEAGDVYEVIVSLLSMRGISMADAENAARNKRDKRGGFREGIVLESFERV